jgi:hypothetical protein
MKVEVNEKNGALIGQIILVPNPNPEPQPEPERYAFSSPEPVRYAFSSHKPEPE